MARASARLPTLGDRQLQRDVVHRQHVPVRLGKRCRLGGGDVHGRFEKRAILPRSQMRTRFGQNGEPNARASRLTGKMVTSLVEFTGLGVSYGALQALNGVSGSFPPGPTGLLGPNGAGKTTLLKTLLGFLKPDRGTHHRVRPRPGEGAAGGAAPHRLHARGGLPPARHDRGALRRLRGRAVRACPRDEATSRAHEVLYYVGLDEARYRASTPTRPGMKQRVKLAQALVHDPDLLLLDEPTNGLDPRRPRGDAGAHPRRGRAPRDEPHPLLAPAARRRVASASA